MKIDIVYTWFDGNDTQWNAKRNALLPPVEQQNQESFCDARIVSNDELKYSLRSVEMYASWVNRIFIITDNQTPQWLDVNHPKIVIVDHKDILPPTALPTFNSNAIEQGIANIKELSNQFLYSNDDTLFGRHTSPDYFFTKEGKTISRMCIPSRKLRKEILNQSVSTYNKTILAVNRTISKDFNKNYEMLFPHHQIDPYSKESIIECLEKYNQWSDKTINSRFRTDEDVQRHIYSLYATATGRGVLKASSITQRRILKLLSMARLIKGIDSCVFTLNQKNIEFSIKHFRAKLICFNDSETVNDDDRKKSIQIIEKLYPKKSSFEL